MNRPNPRDALASTVTGHVTTRIRGGRNTSVHGGQTATIHGTQQTIVIGPRLGVDVGPYLAIDLLKVTMALSSFSLLGLAVGVSAVKVDITATYLKNTGLNIANHALLLKNSGLFVVS